MRRFVGVLLTAGALGAGAAAVVIPRPAFAQSARVRFDIDSVGDSTFTFLVGSARWVTPGRGGMAVDPSRGDELIAEFRVVRVAGGVATAVVTGQTTRLKATDVVVVPPPGRPFYAEPVFWVGAVVGAAVGLLIHVH